MSSGLDSILGGVLGSLTGSRGGPLGRLLLPTVVGLLAGGGLQKILGQFQAHGLGDVAGSWVGAGENQQVSADHVTQVLGHDTVQQVADQAGVSHEEAASALSQVLPEVVNHVTPDGAVPSDAQLSQSLDKLAQSARE